MPLDLRQGTAFTNLGRAFHPVYKHHRWVLWLVASAGAAAAMASYLRGEEWLAILSFAFNSVLAGLIAWALARELDPDRETVSLLAIPIAAATVISFGAVALLPSAVFIGTARYLIRITASAPRRMEVLVIWLMPLGLMLYYQNAVFGLLTVLTFGLEAYFEKFPRSESRYAAAALFATAGYAAYAGLPAFTSLGLLPGLMAGGIGLLVLLKAARMRQPQSRSDFNDQPISLGRLRTVMLLSMAIALITMTGGTPGFLLLGPLWAALLTVGI